ncbi:MAG: choice-of-anchor Q domain-containing protein, partial [Nanoarchaeota archaeon]|nr:choice-of-anchor Q domain-containing protein [Nanoarchaeota archaeon]
SDYIWLNKMNNPNFDNNGAYYSTPKKDQDWLTDKTYVKTSDGTNPTGKIYSPTLGYTFDLAGNDYINFYKCNLYGSVIRKNRVKDFPNGPIPDHITIDSCDIKYSLDYGSLFDLYKGHDYWTIKNSELSYATNAIYTKTFDGIPGARFLKVENNYIHDIGGPNFIHQDAHAVGIQGGEGHIIQNNTIENTGSAIEFWSSSDSMFNMTVRNNFIKNIRVMSTTGGNGIVISGDNKFATSGRRTGFRIYNNIIINTGIGATEADWQGFGISSNNVDRVEIYNNVLYNNLGGIRLSPNTIFVYGSVYNNIIVNPQSEIYAKISGNKFFLDWDNNLYYPLSSLKDTDSYSLFGLRETNSILADPMFVSLNPSNKTDFKLKENSPAIDKGKDVGLSKDSLGNDIDGNPDIGAYEIK